MRPFPETARVHVSKALASDLATAAHGLPVRENEAYYDDGLQIEALDGVRASCEDRFDDLVADIRRGLARAPYAVGISGLNFDAENRLFIALNRAFGRLVSKPLQKPRAQLVQLIHHRADLADPETGQVYTEILHTDAADWPQQVDLISMVCVRPDEGGEGLSRVIGMDAISRDVEDRFGPQTLETLRNEPVPWRLAPEFADPVTWRPVLGDDNLCWRKYTIDKALADPGVRIPGHLAKAVDAMDTAVNGTSQAHEWLMQSGDFLIMDNRKCLHARTAVSRCQSQRLMMRSWIRAEKPAQVVH